MYQFLSFNSYLETSLILMLFATADRKVSQTSLYGICGGRSGSGTVQTS